MTDEDEPTDEQEPSVPLVDGASVFVGDDHTEVYNSGDNPTPDDVHSADDVDPRRLVRDPSPDEVRWYYRNTPYAMTVVDKPIEDAHRHGYDVLNDPTGAVEEFLDDYDPYRIAARKKARRDGLAAVLFQLNDEATISESPRNVDGYEGFQVLTLDDLGQHLTPSTIEQYVEYDSEQLDVLEQGIVVVRDIRSPDHEEIVGYVYEQSESERSNGDGSVIFIHADRCQHFVENPEVDGNIADEWIGHVTGHPILGPIFHQLKALAKANWSIGQTLFRYTSPLHVILTPENKGIGEDHIEEVNGNLDNVNAKSGLTLPPGHDIETHGADGEMDPEPYKDAIVEMLCAGSEFTKSVLQGSQTGTVSGSSTDVKNYHAEVNNYRHTTAEEKQHEAVRTMFRLDQSVVPSFALGFEVSWGPLIRVDDLDKTEGVFRLIQTASNGVSNYLLTPTEAREIVEQEWSEFDVDVELDELTEEDYDEIDRVNVERQHALAKGEQSEEEEYSGNPRVGQNGGGVEEGETEDPSQPQRSE